MNEEWTRKELKGLNTVGLAREEEKDVKKRSWLQMVMYRICRVS